jgi:hypothetical protein
MLEVGLPKTEGGKNKEIKAAIEEGRKKRERKNKEVPMPILKKLKDRRDQAKVSY